MHTGGEIHPSANYYRTDVQDSGSKRYTNYENLPKSEALEVFKELLAEMGITTSWKWEDVNRVI